MHVTVMHYRHKNAQQKWFSVFRST